MLCFKIDDFTIIEKYMEKLLTLKKNRADLVPKIIQLAKYFFLAINDYKFGEYYISNYDHDKKFVFEYHPLYVKFIKFLFNCSPYVN